MFRFHALKTFHLTATGKPGHQHLIRANALYPLTLILILLGVFTKSAQFPFHFWLPQAMAAPTPVSAFLHSATMVKAGVFLLARLYPALADSEWWFYIVTLTGLTTLVVGAILALFQHDLKGLLAYTELPHASCDFNHDPHSAIVDGSQTRVSGPRLVNLLAWFDNEWGFANRMLDVAEHFLAVSTSSVPPAFVKD